MADKNDCSELLAEMLIRMDRQQIQIDKTNEILGTVANGQTRMLTQMDLIYQEQQRFNARQEQFNTGHQQFNARQEEVNLAILQELRLIKTDVRELKETVSNNHRERPRHLEDFMRRAS